MVQFETATERVRGRADSMVSDVRQTAAGAQTAFSDVADTFGDALNESLKTRPYATLAIVAGIGFLFGAAWSR